MCDNTEITEEQKADKLWPLKIQFITLGLLPLILVAINIPDSLKEQFPLLDRLYDIGTIAVAIVLLFAFPIGLIGFRQGRDEKLRPRLNRKTMILGAVNCIIGAMFVGIVLMVLFFGFVVGI